MFDCGFDGCMAEEHVEKLKQRGAMPLTLSEAPDPMYPPAPELTSGTESNVDCNEINAELDQISAPTFALCGVGAGWACAVFLFGIPTLRKMLRA